MAEKLVGHEHASNDCVGAVVEFGGGLDALLDLDESGALPDNIYDTRAAHPRDSLGFTPPAPPVTGAGQPLGFTAVRGPDADADLMLWC